MRTFLRTLLVGLVAAVSLALAHPRLTGRTAHVRVPGRPGTTVYLAGRLPDEALVNLGAAVAARPGAMLIVDSPKQSAHLKRFLIEFKPSHVVPIGDFDDADGLAKRLGVEVEPVVAWPASASMCPLWDGERPKRVVVCPASPRPLLLHAAHLAAVERVPLWVGGGDLTGHGFREVLQVGDTSLPLPSGTKRIRLKRVADVEAACRKALGTSVETAVITNPADLAKGKGGMSSLAPWLAATKRAALLFTKENGRDAAARVEEAGLPELESVVLMGNLQALPTWQRPNPIPGDKDKVIDLEPLTPTTASGLPVSYAVGRLFHEDRAVVPLMLARQRLDTAKAGPRRALVASNPGGGLPLLEAFSRCTASELTNTGFVTTELYGGRLNGEVLREQLPRHDVILWEGHHNTLVKDWGFLEWDEPLPSSFVFLQSCLALMPEKVAPLLSRGAYGVVGTSTRTYSASGGAFSLAYFDALLYEGQTLGGSLRQAKNFLLAYAALKEKRLGGAAKRTGANHRAAWAFSLWGDPTFRLPRPASTEKLSPVRHQVDGDTITLRVPGQTHAEVRSEGYRVKLPPNARLAGLVRGDGPRDVVPLVFAEVRLPGAKADLEPKLRSRLSSGSWVFLWDGRRKVGWLLATPKPDEHGEMRFRVEWSSVRVAGRSE